MKDLFESKKFGVTLVAVLLVLLGITGFVLIKGNSSDQIAQDVGGELDTEVENEWIDPEHFYDDSWQDPEDEEYKKSIAEQYEEYKKEKEDTDGDKKSDKNTGKNKSNNKNSSNNSGGKSNKGSSSGSGSSKSTSSGVNKGPSGVSGSSGSGQSKSTGGGNNTDGLDLPPINVGNENPTVPKLPNSPRPERDEDPDDVGGNIGGDDEPTDPTEPSDPSIPTDPGNVGGGNLPTDTGSIVPVNRPDPIDTAPHETLTEEQDLGKGGLSMITTTYGDNFRILPIGIDRHSTGVTAVFEFYNDSDSPMTITDENIYFDYEAEFGVQTPSYIESGPITVQPKSLTTFKVHAAHQEATLVRFSLNGFTGRFDFSGGQPTIHDVNPIEETHGVIEDLFLQVLSTNDVVGTKDFKMEALGIVLAENNQIGPLKKENGGAVGLVKLRIANTSNKDMKINRIVAASIDFERQVTNDIEYPLSDLSIIGDNAIPTTIKAGEIVDGYVPFYIKDGNHVSVVLLDTNFIDIQVTSIESYNIIR